MLVNWKAIPFLIPLASQMLELAALFLFLSFFQHDIQVQRYRLFAHFRFKSECEPGSTVLGETDTLLSSSCASQQNLVRSLWHKKWFSDNCKSKVTDCTLGEAYQSQVIWEYLTGFWNSPADLAQILSPLSTLAVWNFPGVEAVVSLLAYWYR